MLHVPRIMAFLFACCLAASWAYVPCGRALAAAPKAEGAGRVALVVGNAAYETSPLRNPVNDARDMAASLDAMGFEVTLLLDADEVGMAGAITRFGKRLGPDDVGLFFFAGHGMQVEGRNFLIPVNSDIQEEDEVPYKAIDAGMVLRKMESAGNSVNIVILDACRNNPFARSFRSGSRGLARMDAPSGSLIIYATAPGDVAADGDGRNGIFTENLLKYLQTRGVDVEVMLKSVRRAVFDQTGGRQTPWTSSSLRGSFFFRPGDAQPVDVPPPAPAAPVAAPARDTSVFEAATISVTGVGTSDASESVVRLVSSRDAALRDAYKALERKLKAPPYNMSRKDIRRTFDEGRMVDLVYERDGKRAEIEYEVTLPRGAGK